MKNKLTKILTVSITSVMLIFSSACKEDEAQKVKEEAAVEETIARAFETEALTDEPTEEAPKEAVTEAITEAETEAEETEPKEEPSAPSEASYKTAYKDFIQSMDYDKNAELTFDLIYLDDNDVPELLVSDLCFINLYTYAEGEIHTIIDLWAFGAMGNAGYSYSPYNNSVFNSDADCGGAIRYNVYMSIDDDFELVVSDYYVSYMLEDANKNHFTDVNEKVYDEYVNYIDDERLATDDEIAAMAKGEYEFMSGNMTLEELYAALS